MSTDRAVVNATSLRAEVCRGLTLHRFDALAHYDVDVAVTDRFGGVSRAPFDSLNLGDHVGDVAQDVTENRQRLANCFGVKLANLIFVGQDHGVAVHNADHDGQPPRADIISVTDPTRAVGILVADCVPIVLISPSRHRLAVVHAGWRGLANMVIAEAVSSLDNPGDLVAAIGPSISGEGYQVGPEVASQFSSVSGAVLPDTGDRSRLDLRAVALAHLFAAGVKASRIALSQQTTDGGELFFSDRAARPCGRFALVARWRS